MSTFAPLQFLKSAQNPLVWTAVDNGTDSRTSLIIYTGNANTLPSDTGLYEVNCIMMHQAEKQLYSNIGNAVTPSWAAFGPGSAFPQPLVPGTFLFTDGVSVYWATSLVGQVQYNGSNLNTYGILNFNDLLVASNDVPNSRINVDLDVVSLASNTTFISNLESNLSLQNIGGSLNWSQINQSTVSVDLSTQVTGSISIGNIDVTAIANDSTFLSTLIPNLDENVKVAVDGVTITGDGTTGNPLVATAGAGGNGIALEATVTQTAHGFVVGDVIKVSGTNTFAKAQGNNEINSEAVGIVTTVVSANSFKYISSAIQLAIAPVGTPGSAVWLDPSVAGGMTTTKPSTIGQVARALGTIIESGAKMYFDIAALAEVIGTGSGGSTNFFSTSTPSYGLISPDTGSTAVLELSDGTLFSYPVGTYNNYCITADKTKVYKATITYTIGSNYTISLEEYIGNANGSIGTLAVTYTGTGAHTVGTNNFEGGIFVDGNKVFIPLANGTSLKFFTEWTLSGTSLTSPLTTNLNYSTLTNFVNFYWFYDGTYYYTYNNAANDLITKWTYSAGTFTSVATASLSTSIDTQTSYGTAIGVDPRMKLLFFRIVTGKIGNFGMLVTTGSTFSAPKFVSGVIYLENSSI